MWGSDFSIRINFLIDGDHVHIFSLADQKHSGFLNSATNGFDRRIYDDWFVEKPAVKTKIRSVYFQCD